MSKNVETTCNLCGKKLGRHANTYALRCECMYPSKYDGLSIDIDICVDCMDTLIDQCAVDPLLPMRKTEPVFQTI